MKQIQPRIKNLNVVATTTENESFFIAFNDAQKEELFEKIKQLHKNYIKLHPQEIRISQVPKTYKNWIT